MDMDGLQWSRHYRLLPVKARSICRRFSVMCWPPGTPDRSLEVFNPSFAGRSRAAPRWRR